MFETRDIVMASSLLSLGHQFIGLSLEPGKRYFNFQFETDLQIETNIKMYRDGDCRVCPKSILFAHKQLKNKIFDRLNAAHS